ncbi:MAG: glycosyltransferase family A protein [Chthoniobacterales bacterium]
MSFLAVIIPLFNHAAYIGAALQSVQAQTQPAQRVIVIDDGSTDDSFAIAQAAAASGTEVLRQENRGAHATLNRGIEMAADCDLVAILNSDDLWHPERLARCRKAFDMRPELDAVCTGLHLIDPVGARLADDAPKMRRHLKVWSLVEKENDPLLSLAVSNFAKTTSNLVARRSFLLAHPFGGYRYVHDYHCFLQAALPGKMGVVAGDLLGYRVHQTNTIKADGRRAVVAETVQMHLDLMASLAPELAASAALRQRFRLYLQRLFGNHTDFRGEIFLQVIADAIAKNPELFAVSALGDFEEFEGKSAPLPSA